MDTDSRNDDLAQLNALVDGELAPSEHAAMAARLATDRDLARVHATLARLKASAGELAESQPEISLPAARRGMRPLVFGAVGCAMAVALVLIGANTWLQQRSPADTVDTGPTQITLAALPGHTTVPHLESGGLKLMGVAIETHDSQPLVIATYRGPHGCRLDLRAWPVGAVMPASVGTSRYGWAIGDIAYELVAHGMPDWRFAILANVAERQTRQLGDPQRNEQRLRQAAIGAPPCLG
jgi:hypothetical protein